MHIGTCEFDEASGLLLDRDGAPLALRPKAFALLRTLAAQPNAVIGRAALMAALWPNAAPTPEALTHLVREIRLALGDTGGTLLRTVSGGGYALFIHKPPVPATLPGVTRAADSFVGRSVEIARLRDRLSAHRLVTGTGIGGVGKTRLVMELMAEMAGTGLPAIHIDLAPVSREDGVARTVANAVGAGAGSGEHTAGEAAIIALARRTVLLVMDNAEHVAGTVADLLRQVLLRCPRVSALVTSRVALELPEETVFALLPLPVPPEQACSMDDLLRYDGVRLFVERAGSRVPGFRIDEVDPGTLAALCQGLDGIPLAIEMAVARSHVMTPGQLLSRLDHRFEVLTTRKGSLGNCQEIITKYYTDSVESP